MPILFALITHNISSSTNSSIKRKLLLSGTRCHWTITKAYLSLAGSSVFTQRKGTQAQGKGNIFILVLMLASGPFSWWNKRYCACAYPGACAGFRRWWLMIDDLNDFLGFLRIPTQNIISASQLCRWQGRPDSLVSDFRQEICQLCG